MFQQGSRDVPMPGHFEQKTFQGGSYAPAFDVPEAFLWGSRRSRAFLRVRTRGVPDEFLKRANKGQLCTRHVSQTPKPTYQRGTKDVPDVPGHF